LLDGSELCRNFGDEARSSGVVCRRFEDLDAVFESDTCDNLGQVICAFQPPIGTIPLQSVYGDDNLPQTHTLAGLSSLVAIPMSGLIIFGALVARHLADIDVSPRGRFAPDTVTG
jgi:hypothetical protein